MATYFLDSSAVVKRYFPEIGLASQLAAIHHALYFAFAARKMIGLSNQYMRLQPQCLA